MRGDAPRFDPPRASSPPQPELRVAMAPEAPRVSIVPQLPIHKRVPPRTAIDASWSPIARSEKKHDAALIASVRLGATGELLDTFGGNELLPQLVAYVRRVLLLLRQDFSLDPFEALHAELSGVRILMFEENGAIVGLMMRPGDSVNELRQRLGV